jgi:putative heme-binding domain-containing protein
MGRKLRVDYPGAIHRVMNRGDRREPIVKDDADRQRFVETPGEACAETGWQRVVENFTPALRLTGDRRRGAATLGKLCLACHCLQGHGQRVGPDLSGINSKPADALLIELLDPSRVIAPDYVTYEVTRTDGETVTGLIASETEIQVTLRHAGAPDETIPRSQLKSLRTTGESLMPDGLEAGLSHQDVADLLEFLRNPDADLLPR